ncbi:MAG TPA: hypothetical protein VFY96_10320 [Candidatus Binatia bacterium]|nr:hypothetical protein [Candidatus Binatia bacterium]
MLLVLVAAMLMFTCCPNSHGAAPTRKIVIGHAAMNARVAPLWVAQDHGTMPTQFSFAKRLCS